MSLIIIFINLFFSFWSKKYNKQEQINNILKMFSLKLKTGIILLSLLTFLASSLFINELKPDIRSDLDRIVDNQYGRQIMMVFQQ